MEQHTKDKIQYATAVLTLMKEGDVPSGALWYFGQTMVYAATIFGFKLVVDDYLRKNK